eukprot:11589355-Ditylum_brightwellii.AAC.1
MNAMSNFEQEAERGTYALAEDPTFLPDKEDLTGDVLVLSMNKNDSYGRKITSLKPVLVGKFCAARDNNASSKGGGCTMIVQP